MECCGGLAQNVITTIGQAFELRLKECLRRDPANSSTAAQDSNAPAPSGPMPAVRGQRRPDDVEYYNDMPGKRPPPPTPTTQPSSSSPPQWPKKDSLSSNLIDFSDAASSSASRQTHAPSAAAVTSPAGPEYVNGVVAATTATKTSGFSRANRPDPVGIPPASATSGKDPFDMSKYTGYIMGEIINHLIVMTCFQKAPFPHDPQPDLWASPSRHRQSRFRNRSVKCTISGCSPIPSGRSKLS